MKRAYDDRSEKTSNYGKVRRKEMASFSVCPRNRFERQFPSYTPTEIGNFSLNEFREFLPNDSKLKFFVRPQPAGLSLDLRDGYGSFIARDESIKEYLDTLLKWILANKEKFDFSAHDRVPMDFLCWRGLLTKILCTPYENQEGWKIAAARYRNCIYLCEFDKPQRIQDRRQEDPRQKEMTYWGFKFEQYVTADSVNGVPDTARPVNNNEAYVSVIKTPLNNHSLVFGGEVDCREGNEYVELKTNREITHPRQDRNFKRFKLIKWWAQSFLIGIPKVICGFRDDDGVVKSLEEFRTMNIPRCCQEIHDCWKGTVCLNFCDDLLKFFQDTVTEDYDKGIFVFEWMPPNPVTWTMENPDSEYAFLPRWYIEKMESSN